MLRDEPHAADDFTLGPKVMYEGDFKLQGAGAADLDAVLSLLASIGLPGEGVAEHLKDFLLARDGAGRLVGCIGMERHGRVGLLRSAAVVPELQGSGVGSSLVRALLERAARGGVEELALLTTTASGFFARKFGFTEAARDRYAERLAHSPEWNLPRCSSAVLMSLNLNKSEGA